MKTKNAAVLNTYWLRTEMYAELVKLADLPRPANPLDTLTPEQWATLERAIYATWGVIGGDAVAACEEWGEELSSEGALDATIDGGCMDVYGGSEACEIMDALCAEYDYVQVRNAIAKRVRL